MDESASWIGALHALLPAPVATHLPDLALAGAVFGDSGAAATLAAALLGGTVAVATHFAKSGARAAVNTSPEPFSNLAVSLGENALVPAGPRA